MPVTYSKLQGKTIPCVFTGEQAFLFQGQLSSCSLTKEELNNPKLCNLMTELTTRKSTNEGSTTCYLDEEAWMCIDYPVLQNWYSVASPRIFIEGGKEEPTLLVTFGKYNGLPHIEECASSGIAQLVQGTKRWFFWPPGPKPNSNTKAQLVIWQFSGDTMYIPGGWWHAVHTISEGAVLVGILWPGSLRNMLDCGQAVKLKELQEVADDLGLNYSNRRERQSVREALTKEMEQEVGLYIYACSLYLSFFSIYLTCI